MPNFFKTALNQVKPNKKEIDSSFSKFFDRFDPKKREVKTKFNFDPDAPRMTIAPKDNTVTKKAADSTSNIKTTATPTPPPAPSRDQQIASIRKQLTDAQAQSDSIQKLIDSGNVAGTTPTVPVNTRADEAAKQEEALRSKILSSFKQSEQEKSLENRLGALLSGLAVGEADIEAGAAPRGITTPFVTGRQAALRRQTAAEALPIQTQLGLLQQRRADDKERAMLELGFSEEDIAESNKQDLQSIIAEQISAGITDPATIISAVQESGLPFDIQEITSALDGVAPEVAELSTQVIEAGGNKVLINTQTGEIIKNLGATAGAISSARDASTKESEKDAKKQAENATLQEKIDVVEELKDHPGLKGAVGPNKLARLGLLASQTGADVGFASKIHSLVNQEFIDKLVSAKAEGATFGALNESEADALKSAATFIADAEMKDENNRPIGKWDISEKEFIDGLNTIQETAAKAIRRAGGTVDVEIDESEIASFIE